MRLRQGLVTWGVVLACAGATMPAQAAHLADGTIIQVRLIADLLSSQAAAGSLVDMEIAAPLMLQGSVLIPPGSPVWGTVYSVKKGRIVYFDIVGVRLPNRQTVRLRASPQRPKNSKSVRNEIKVESPIAGDWGAPKGSEFTAYLDQDLDVEATDAPANPTAPAATSAVTMPASISIGDYITVECFSEPTGADIMIDDEFHGSTPSILKLHPGNHRIEYRLDGYKPHSQPLILSPATGLHTVRMTLEEQP